MKYNNLNTIAETRSFDDKGRGLIIKIERWLHQIDKTPLLTSKTIQRWISYPSFIHVIKMVPKKIM